MLVLLLASLLVNISPGSLDDSYRCPRVPGGRMFTFGEKCYRFVANDMTWHQAQHDCQTYGGNLVHILNQATQNFIYTTAKGTLGWGVNGMWIGAYDPQQTNIFSWINGGRVTWGFWAPGEPSCGIIFCEEFCGQMRLDDYGRWHDYHCTKLSRYHYCCMYNMGPKTTTTRKPTTTTRKPTTTTRKPTTTTRKPTTTPRKPTTRNPTTTSTRTEPTTTTRKPTPTTQQPTTNTTAVENVWDRTTAYDRPTNPPITQFSHSRQSTGTYVGLSTSDQNGINVQSGAQAKPAGYSESENSIHLWVPYVVTALVVVIVLLVLVLTFSRRRRRKENNGVLAPSMHYSNDTYGNERGQVGTPNTVTHNSSDERRCGGAGAVGGQPEVKLDEECEQNRWNGACVKDDPDSCNPYDVIPFDEGADTKTWKKPGTEYLTAVSLMRNNVNDPYSQDNISEDKRDSSTDKDMYQPELIAEKQFDGYMSPSSVQRPIQFVANSTARSSGFTNEAFVVDLIPKRGDPGREPCTPSPGVDHSVTIPGIHEESGSLQPPGREPLGLDSLLRNRCQSENDYEKYGQELSC